MGGGGKGRRRQRGTERTRWAPRECGPRSVCKAEARGVLSRFLLWTQHRQSLDHSVLQGNQPVLLVGGSPGLPACTVRPYVACLPGLQFMGKTITKQNLFGFTPPALLDPRAYSSDSLGEPPGSQHLWCALFLPPPPQCQPLAPPCSGSVPLLSVLTSKVPRAAAPRAAMPGRTVPPPVLWRLLVASCAPRAPDLVHWPSPEDSAEVLAQGSLSDRCWPSCRFWASAPLCPSPSHTPLWVQGLCLKYSYYDLLLHLPNPLTPQTKSRPSKRFPLMLNRQLTMANPGEETHWSKAFPNSKQILAIAHVNSYLAPEQLLTHPL